MSEGGAVTGISFGSRRALDRAVALSVRRALLEQVIHYLHACTMSRMQHRNVQTCGSRLPGSILMAQSCAGHDGSVKAPNLSGFGASYLHVLY